MTESNVLQQGLDHWGVFGQSPEGSLIGGGLRSGKPRWGKDKQSWTISKAHSARCKSYEFEPETKRIQRANRNDKDNVFLHDENLLPASGDLLGFGSTIQMQWADLFEMASSSGSTSTATASTTPHGRFSTPDQLTGKL